MMRLIMRETGLAAAVACASAVAFHVTGSRAAEFMAAVAVLAVVVPWDYCRPEVGPASDLDPGSREPGTDGDRGWWYLDGNGDIWFPGDGGNWEPGTDGGGPRDG